MIDVCWKDEHPFAGKMILLALYTGARKTEILNLRWDGIDYDNGRIYLCVSIDKGTTKGGESDDYIPMNSTARKVLESIPKHHKNPWLFPSPVSSKPYVKMVNPLNDIKRRAQISKNFRIMHGCRHLFGALAAGLGGVLATKELLRHKDISTSETYIHLDVNHWQNMSENVVDIINSKIGQPPTGNDGGKVIKLKKKTTIK